MASFVMAVPRPWEKSTKCQGCPPTAAELEHFVCHNRQSALRCNGEFISRQSSASLAKLQGDGNRAIRTTADEFLEAPASCDGLGHVLRQSVLQKTEHIEKGGLAGTVLPDERGQPGRSAITASLNTR